MRKNAPETERRVLKMSVVTVRQNVQIQLLHKWGMKRKVKKNSKKKSQRYRLCTFSPQSGYHLIPRG